MTFRNTCTTVSESSIRDGILIALRAKNDLSTVPVSSVLGLLQGIKTCACSGGSACADAMISDFDVCTIEPSMKGDAAGLGADITTQEYYESIDSALTFLQGQVALAPPGASMTITWTIGSEDPDCLDVTYGIGGIVAPPPPPPPV